MNKKNKLLKLKLSKIHKARFIQFLSFILFWSFSGIENIVIAQSNNIRVEAEDMALTNFVIESGSSAFSGLKKIKLPRHTSGLAQVNFPGSSGQYNVLVRYIDESDGQSNLSVSIGNREVDSWVLDVDSEEILTRTVASDLSINTGDVIEIAGTQDAWEFVRIDYIEFQPVVPVVPNYTLSVNTVGAGNVSFNPDGGIYADSSEVTLIATPAVDWVFDGWSGDFIGTDTLITLIMDSDKALTATFRTTLPVINSFTPLSGISGTIVEISGNNYSGTTEVTFNGVPADTFTVVSDTLIQANLPVGATTGPLGITTAKGTSVSSADFIVIEKPILNSFSPDSGAIGTEVTITGIHFSHTTSVLFNDLPSLNMTVVSDNTILAEVPAGATSGGIVVLNAAGSDTSRLDFIVQEVSTVRLEAEDMLLTNFVVEGGDSSFSGLKKIKLPSGTGVAQTTFSDSSGHYDVFVRYIDESDGQSRLSVSIGGVEIDSWLLDVDSDETLTRKVASDIAINSGDSIEISGQQDHWEFVRVDYIEFRTVGSIGPPPVQLPIISSFFPMIGESGIDDVTIVGSNFTNSTEVTFNGVVASNFNIESSSVIQVSIPTGARTGKIGVSNAAGKADSKDDFIVNLSHTIMIDSLNGFTLGTQTGGAFVSQGGWQVIGQDNILVYDLGKYVESGYLELDIRNFDPRVQNSYERHHVLSMFRNPWGNHHPVENQETLWDIHTGFRYNPGVKFLSWTYQENESITNDTDIWDIGQTYHIKIVWNDTTIQYIRNGSLQLSQTNSAPMQLRYLFIGRDLTVSGDLNTGFKNNQYPAMVGPIYANVTVKEFEPQNDVIAPEITSIRPVDFYANGVRLSWSTDKAAVCYVEYGTTDGYGLKTDILGPPSFTHETTIAGLEAGQAYHYRVVAFNNAGTQSASADQIFTTLIDSVFIFKPVADTFVESSGIYDTIRDYGNYGWMNLLASEGRECYLRFDVTGIPATIVNASLRLHGRQTGNSGGTVYELLTNWSEDSVTYRNKPNLLGKKLGSIASVVEGQWKSVDFPIVMNGSAVYNFSLLGSGNEVVSFDSRESTNYQPELIIAENTTPLIVDFDPKKGVSGANVSIFGFNFIGATGVTFNGVSVANFTVVSDTLIQAESPVGATTGPIGITTAKGTSISSADFVVVEKPIISSFSPNSGSIGTEVTITGVHFSSAASVLFNNELSLNFTAVSDSAILAEVPPGATSGGLVVLNAAGSDTSSLDFIVQELSTVRLEAEQMLLTNFVVEGGDSSFSGLKKIKLPGGTGVAQTTFSDSSGHYDVFLRYIDESDGQSRLGVSIGGVEVDSWVLDVDSDETLTRNVASDIAINSGDSIEITGQQDHWEFVRVDYIEFRPAVPVTPQFSITVNTVGSGSVTLDPVGGVYNEGTQVTLKAIPSFDWEFSGWSGDLTGLDSSMTMTMDSDKSVTATFQTTFPVIRSFTPLSGISGTVVDISGNNFTGATGVTFNGVPVANFTVVSDTLIETIVPENVTSGLISVTTAFGQGISSVDFIVEGEKQPVIHIEAENMFLDGYVLEPADTSFSGSMRIKLSTKVGTATQIFPGPSGVYDVLIRYVDESDGQSDLSVSIGGSVINSWMLDLDTDSLTSKTVANSLSMDANTQITIEGKRNGGEFVRVDYIDFQPVNGTVIIPIISTFSPASGGVGTEVTLTGANFSATGAGNFAGSGAIRIMPLGDSITKGVTGSTDDAGYRNDLAALLDTDGIAYDFVGSQATGVGFDNDHEGHNGYWADEVLAELDTWLNLNPPEMVLFHIGTNDISSGQTNVSTITEIGQDLDVIKNFDPNIVVILASIVPRRDGFNSITDDLNQRIANLVTERALAGDNIYYAGINEAFVSNSNWATDYFPVDNDIHPNDTGYSVMANVWFDAIVNVLNDVQNLTVGFNGAIAQNVTLDSDNQIRAIVPAGATSGPISVTNLFGTAFSTSDFVVNAAAGPASLVLSSPSAGENWDVESSHVISWKSSGRIDRVNVSYSKDNGSTWNRLASNIKNDGKFVWRLSADEHLESAKYVVKVSDVLNSNIADKSQTEFTINKTKAHKNVPTFNKIKEAVLGRVDKKNEIFSTGDLNHDDGLGIIDLLYALDMNQNQRIVKYSKSLLEAETSDASVKVLSPQIVLTDSGDALLQLAATSNVPVRAFQLELTFDNTKFQIQHPLIFDNFTGMQIHTNTSNNHLTVVGYYLKEKQAEMLPKILIAFKTKLASHYDGKADVRIEKAIFVSRAKQAIATELEDRSQKTEIPSDFTLFQNYPNPFNLETQIKYNLPQKSRVKIQIFNLRGELVRTLLDEEMQAGQHKIAWDAKNDNEIVVASGIYLYRISAGSWKTTRKMTLLK